MSKKRRSNQTTTTRSTQVSNPFETATTEAPVVNETATTTEAAPASEPNEDEAAVAGLPEVETPEALDDETEEVPATAATNAAAGESKPAKAAKAPARPPVPEGYVTPVGFAKILSKHLSDKATAAAREKDPNAAEVTIEIAPQMIYSYMNNADPAKANVKNPWPRYSEGGRDRLLKVEESLKWWDDKDARVAASKASQADKTAKKAEKAKAGTEAAAVETPSGPIEEAE